MTKRLSGLAAVVLGLALATGVFAQTETLKHSDAASVSVKHTTGAAQPVKDGDYAQRALKRHLVRVQVHRAHCSWRESKCYRHFHAYNARVNQGAQDVANDISGTAVSSYVYIALTADTAAPLATDTACPSEIVTGGLSRAAGTFGNYTAPAALNGTASYTVTATYTATAGYTINKLCLMNLASVGHMLFETKLGATVTGNSGDTITVTWTINV